MNLYPQLPPEILEELDLTDIAVKRLCMKLWSFSKPVIAAINGLAVGAGFTMPLAGADLIYMAEDAWIGFYFIKRAVMAEFSSHFLLPFPFLPFLILTQSQTPTVFDCQLRCSGLNNHSSLNLPPGDDPMSSRVFAGACLLVGLVVTTLWPGPFSVQAEEARTKWKAGTASVAARRI